MLVLFLMIWIVPFFSIMLIMHSHFGYPLGSSILEIHKVIHISFDLLHIFVLDEGFIVDCLGV